MITLACNTFTLKGSYSTIYCVYSVVSAVEAFTLKGSYSE